MRGDVSRLFSVALATSLVWCLLLLADIYDWPPQPRTQYDSAIVQRAHAILSSTQIWNKQGNRECPWDAKTVSLYCALRQAHWDVTGDFHHESAVMEAVREAILRRQPDRQFAHILMDFNNAADTSLSDVHQVLGNAANQLSEP